MSFIDATGNDTQVMITEDTFMGASVGTHASVRVDNGGSGRPILYDPSGSYKSKERGSSDTFAGADTIISDYVKHHEGSGSKVNVYNFKTTASQEAKIAKQIDKAGGGGLFGCASKTSEVISGLGPFKDVEGTMFPGELQDQVSKIEGAEKMYTTPDRGNQ